MLLSSNGARNLTFFVAATILWLSLMVFLSGFSIGNLIRGLPDLSRMIVEMMPPSIHGLDSVARAMLESLLMAFAGTTFGAIISIPLGALGGRRIEGGSQPMQFAARFVASVFRAVPDIVWGLLFVVWVGVGRFAGTLALTVGVAGYCGRLFAESIDDCDFGPAEVLISSGVKHLDIFFCAIMPQVAAVWLVHVLYSLEKAIRSSVVLGLVGAGGIGLELRVSMELFRYHEALTVMLTILVTIILIEQLGRRLRRLLRGL